jgi:hypothetical protein
MSTPLQPDVNIGPSAVIAGWVEASIAIIIVSARIYTQTRVVGRVGLDDYLMVLALVSGPSCLLNSSHISTAGYCHPQHITRNCGYFLGNWETRLLSYRHRKDQRDEIRVHC